MAREAQQELQWAQRRSLRDANCVKGHADELIMVASVFVAEMYPAGDSLCSWLKAQWLRAIYFAK